MARELVINDFIDNTFHRLTSVTNLYFTGDFSYTADSSSVTDLSSVEVLSYAAYLSVAN